MSVSATGNSTGPRYSVAQILQNLSASNTSQLLNASGMTSNSPIGASSDSATNAAAMSMLMHTAPQSLIPLLANSNLLNGVINYRMNEQKAASSDEDSSSSDDDKPYDAASNPANPAYWVAQDAKLAEKYKAMFPDVVGSTTDQSA